MVSMTIFFFAIKSNVIRGSLPFCALPHSSLGFDMATDHLSFCFSWYCWRYAFDDGKQGHRVACTSHIFFFSPLTGLHFFDKSAEAQHEAQRTFLPT